MKNDREDFLNPDTDDQFVEDQAIDELDTAAELSGLQDEAATLADSELEDEANMPMEGQDFRLESALRSSRSERGDAGYEKNEFDDQEED
jgi:hypothetical protein